MRIPERRPEAKPCAAPLRTALALFFIGAGVLHFLYPAPYVRIMPPALPYPLELVYLSGACEILGGCGVLLPQTRRAAGIGLILLLVAVFPANIQMLLNQLHKEGLSLFSALLLLRLPLQLVFIRWVDRCTRHSRTAQDAAA